MNDNNRGKTELLQEIDELRQKIAELEAASRAHVEASKELTHTKDFLDNIIENSLDSIVVTDNKGYVSRINRFFLVLTGYTQKEVIGRHIASFSPLQEGTYRSATGEMITIGPDFFNNIETNYTSLLEDGKISLWETCIIRKDKTLVPVEQNVVYLFDSNHNTIGAVGLMRDITKRKKTEKEILQMKDSLSNKVIDLSMINDISEVLLSTRELNEILHIILIGATSYHGLGFNRAFLFLINKEQDCLDGRIAMGALGVSEARKLWSCLKHEKLSLKEILLSKYGEMAEEDQPINNLVKNINIPLNDSTSVFSKAVFKQKSYNIKIASQKSPVDRQFIKQAGTGSFVLVPLVARGKILGVLVADNFVTKKPITDGDVNRLRAFVNHASLAIENSHLYKSIEEKVAELSRAYNDLKQTRDQLLRYERLSTVGEMAAKIAHDIRNPLTAVGGFARRLLKKIPRDTENIRYLEIIVREIERMEKILGDLLSFTAPSAPELVHVDINRVIKNILEVFAIEFEHKNIVVEKKMKPDLPKLMLDEDQIRRVLTNIIKNALEAISSNGTITAATALKGDMLEIEIHDTGEGILEEDMGRLFEPFFTRKASGSGLGLTLSAQIIENHGGSIDVKSTPPQGSAFIIKLPVMTG